MEVANIQNLRNKMQDYLYLVSRIVLPIGVMILLASFVAEKVELKDGIVFSFIEVNVEGIAALTYKTVKGAIIFVILWTLYYKIVKEIGRAFAENKQGNFPMLFYHIARFLGYEKVSLVNKSVPLQFSILNSRVFNDYHTNETGITVIEKEDISYKKDEIDGDPTEINIGIFDSYDGDKSMLPSSVKSNKTILLIPKKKETDVKRFYSEVLINDLNSILKENAKTRKFNLFFFTNPFTNKKIYENVFNTKTDKYVLKVYFFNYQKRTFENKYNEIRP